MFEPLRSTHEPRSAMLPFPLPPCRILLKTIVVVAWLILCGLLIKRELLVPRIDTREAQTLAQAREEQFYGIWYQQKRIGYTSERYEPIAEGRIRVQQTANLQLQLGATPQPIQMELTGELTTAMHLQSFAFRFTSALYRMEAKGRVQAGTLQLTIETGQNVLHKTIILTEPLQLPLNRRAQLLQQLPNPGDRGALTLFDPLSLAPKKSIVRYTGREKLEINNRIHHLFHFVETFESTQTQYWLNDRGRTVKEISPTGFTLLAEPEFQAKNLAPTGQEPGSPRTIPYEGSLPEAGVDHITYRLTLPVEGGLDLDGGRQQLAGDLLTLHRERLGQKVSPAQCEAPTELGPSRHLQTDHEEIKDQAANIIGNERDPLQRVRLLARWVYQNIENRPVLGVPDGLATLRSKRGGSSEHATLFAALARSQGIPATIAIGVALQQGGFSYHVWNEVCVGGQWISVDTTIDQLPADLFHIRLLRGELAEQLKVGILLNKLQLTVIDQDHGPAATH